MPAAKTLRMRVRRHRTITLADGSVHHAGEEVDVPAEDAHTLEAEAWALPAGTPEPDDEQPTD